MDTDELSNEAYNGIIGEAEKLTHDLTLFYGVLSSECDDEDEYLDEAAEMTKELLQADDDELEEAFWGNPPNKKKLKATCEKILKNIERIKSIPLDEREYEF